MEKIITIFTEVLLQRVRINVIDIQNDLTYEKVPQNYSDKFTVYVARTLSGKANNNTLSIKDSVISLPLYAFITSEITLDGIDYIAKNQTIMK